MSKTGKTSSVIASYLLDIEAIKLSIDSPFTWASGWKSPIYCDNRLALSYPEIRNYIRDALADVIRTKFSGSEIIAGVATAGIPQGALVADRLGLPFIYVRSKPKGHGLTNQIEGKVESGKNVVVIEDLVSTGGSSLKAVESLRMAGMNVLGMVSIFTYGFPAATQNFSEAGVDFVSLSDYDELLEVALERQYIREDQLTSLNAWRKNPSDWN